MSARRWLVAISLALVGSCDAFVGPDPSASNASVFDLVWTDFDRHYSAFDVHQVDWNQKRVQYRDQAITAPTAGALADVIGAMMNDLSDVHVTLYTPGKVYRYTGYEARPYYFEVGRVFASPYVSTSKVSVSRQIRFGRLGQTLLYLWIPSMGGEGWDSDLDDVIASFPGVAGVIIDIRDNGGGSNQIGSGIAGRFADTKRLFGYTRFRSGPRHDDLTDFYPMYVTPKGRTNFAGPVVVLTSVRNFSAAEDFVQQMRTLPSVTVVGDTTGGASSYPVYRELPNGWTYRLSEALFYDGDRKLLEIVGIPPDVFLRQTQANTDAGIDAVLEKGCEVLGVPRCGRP